MKMDCLETKEAQCEESHQGTFQYLDGKVKKEDKVPDINDDLRKISVRNDIFQTKGLCNDYSANKPLNDFKDKFPEKIKCDQCKRWLTYKSSWDIHRRYVCRGRKSSALTRNDTNVVTQTE